MFCKQEIFSSQHLIKSLIQSFIFPVSIIILYFNLDFRALCVELNSNIFHFIFLEWLLLYLFAYIYGKMLVPGVICVLCVCS